MGPFEIRPAADLNEMIKESEQRRQRTSRDEANAAGGNLNFEGEEHTCQRFESRDLVFRWTVSAQG